MTKRILILVEGPTEEKFVKAVLSPYFSGKNITLVATILVTKTVKDGPNFKGGIVSYPKAKKDILNLLHDSNASLITTMFDLYAIKKNFPGFDLTSTDCYSRVKNMENEIEKDINNPRFCGYLQLHEFEALLFSSPKEISETMGDRASYPTLLAIRQSFSSPEEINNGPETCPSRRLTKIYNTYKKIIFGSLISKRIGMETMRKECPHFNEWISKLESI